MRNVGEPPNDKRLVLKRVVHSVLFYAVPIWSKILDVVQYKPSLERAQKSSLVVVLLTYRMVSIAVSKGWRLTN